MILRNKKTGEIKEYWFIYGNQVLKNECDGVIEDRFKEIGNYFETEEEAEKVVEKLKAWKRLKEAGYYFTYDSIKEGDEKHFILRLGCVQEKRMKPVAECESNYRDLKFLFGGKE